MTGEWRIESQVAGAISAMTPREAQALVGRSVRIGPAIELPWLQCGETRWTVQIAPADELLADWNLSSADRATLGLSTRQARLWRGRCVGQAGTTVEIAQTDAGLVTYWDGVAFALRRPSGSSH